MAGDGAFELQTAVFTVLDADSALGALVNGVHDFVPDDGELPYVAIGDDTSIWSGTMTVDWHNVTMTIHSYAYGEGRKTCKQIMSAIYDALHNTVLTITGKTHVKTLQEFSDTFLEDDGTYHGVQRFRLIMHDPFA